MASPKRTRVRLDFTITHDKPIALFSVLDMAEGAIRAADSERPDVYIEPGARMIVSRPREYRQDSEARDGKPVPAVLLVPPLGARRRRRRS